MNTYLVHKYRICRQRLESNRGTTRTEFQGTLGGCTRRSKSCSTGGNPFAKCRLGSVAYEIVDTFSEALSVGVLPLESCCEWMALK